MCFLGEVGQFCTINKCPHGFKKKSSLQYLKPNTFTMCITSCCNSCNKIWTLHLSSNSIFLHHIPKLYMVDPYKDACTGHQNVTVLAQWCWLVKQLLPQRQHKANDYYNSENVSNATINTFLILCFLFYFPYIIFILFYITQSRNVILN